MEEGQAGQTGSAGLVADCDGGVFFTLVEQVAVGAAVGAARDGFVDFTVKDYSVKFVYFLSN